MISKNLCVIIALLLFVVGCSKPMDFNYALGRINEVNGKYGTDLQSYPAEANKIDSLVDELSGLKKEKLSGGQEAFDVLVDYRILNLEAEKLYLESQKYGNAGGTKNGFGCKRRPLILESASLRNMSSLKGFEAAKKLSTLVKDYPKEAAIANLSSKNVLFFNATFYDIANEAESDSNIINSFCPENITLDLYKDEFRRNKNLSEGYISKLSYQQAASEWKHERGIE